MPNWTNEQKQAIYEKGSNILVAAAAGSGKTAVLVERIINKIINEKVDIDKLLVVTFTNAAASEMRERVLKAIYKKILFEEKYENNDEDFLKLINTYTEYRDDTPLKDLIITIYKYIQSNPYPEKWLHEKIEMFNLR